MSESEVVDPQVARQRVAAYLAAHDRRHGDDEGAGGPSTRNEVARLITMDGTHRLLIDDLRALVAPRTDETAAVFDRPGGAA